MLRIIGIVLVVYLIVRVTRALRDRLDKRPMPLSDDEADAKRLAADRGRLLKLESDQRAVAELEQGGSPERPIAVTSPAVVEARASAIACVFCGGKVLAQNHEARTIDAARLRVVTVECRLCGRTRSLYFSLDGALPN